MSEIEKVDKYLSEAGMFFLATTDGDQPKCRPLGLHILHDNKIYFGVGTFKEVYKQMQENPKIEIVASRGKDILRYYGKAVFENNQEVIDKAFTVLSDLKQVYEENGWEMGIFYIDDATAEFRNMFAIEESYEFKY